ncbi:MAG: hypothetical protein ACE5H1_12725 [Thermodesulfobacteriota bacterium]
MESFIQDNIIVLFDIVAVCAIIISGTVIDKGGVCRYSRVAGLAIGLFISTLLIATTPFIAPTFNSSLHIQPGRSPL